MNAMSIHVNGASHNHLARMLCFSYGFYYPPSRPPQVGTVVRHIFLDQSGRLMSSLAESGGVVCRLLPDSSGSLPDCSGSLPDCSGSLPDSK